MSWVAATAASLGASEAALKLILGQVLGYPLMLLYRKHLASLDPGLQHAFFFLSGLLTGHWVIGADVVHSLYAVLGTYLILTAAGGTLTSVIVSFVFNLGYLLVGYLYTESEGYDICWTMPHCVLCLRLIGLTFDCYDGERARRLGPAVLSKDQSKSYLPDQPSLLEMLSHSFFIGGYFVGPQFPMRKYRAFVTPTYTAALPASPLPYGFKRLGLALCYMVFHIIGSSLLPSDWPASQDFASTPLLLRLLLMPIWVKVILAKYLFAWLVAEGVCVLSGLSFVEQRPDGSVDWRGCANVKVGRLETAVCFGQVIEAFNINTNHWVAVYVYKRFKFLGNQMVSQVITLVFLAVWHGFHFGYYLTFLNEFLTIRVEREFLALWSRSSRVEGWKKSLPWLEQALPVVGWLWVTVFLPHTFIPFSLLLWTPSMAAYGQTFFMMYVIYGLWWLVLKAQLKAVLGGPAKQKVEDPGLTEKVEEEEKKPVEVEEEKDLNSQVEEMKKDLGKPAEPIQDEAAIEEVDGFNEESRNAEEVST